MGQLPSCWNRNSEGQTKVGSVPFKYFPFSPHWGFWSKGRECELSDICVLTEVGSAAWVGMKCMWVVSVFLFAMDSSNAFLSNFAQVDTDLLGDLH